MGNAKNVIPQYQERHDRSKIQQAAYGAISQQVVTNA
jgi:hypothetical protein